MTGRQLTRVVVAAGGLGTRVSSWSRYLPKEFYPVDGRPGIAHLLDEIAALGPAEVVIIYHPYYEAFAAWARAALSPQGQDRYHQAARIRDANWPAGLTVPLISQHGPYADLTSVLNGADHLAAGSDLYVAFADNLYRGDNPLLALRAAPPGHPATRPSWPVATSLTWQPAAVSSPSGRQTASCSCKTSPKSPAAARPEP
jgi:UTP-glucose-1-phosphate uridylyltransferase